MLNICQIIYLSWAYAEQRAMYKALYRHVLFLKNIITKWDFILHNTDKHSFSSKVTFYLASKRSAGGTPYVNLRECVTYMPLPSANKAACSGFQTQRRCHQKFKTGVSVAPQKELQNVLKIFLASLFKMWTLIFL